MKRDTQKETNMRLGAHERKALCSHTHTKREEEQMVLIKAWAILALMASGVVGLYYVVLSKMFEVLYRLVNL
jgi:hypothetical protein